MNPYTVADKTTTARPVKSRPQNYRATPILFLTRYTDPATRIRHDLIAAMPQNIGLFSRRQCNERANIYRGNERPDRMKGISMEIVIQSATGTALHRPDAFLALLRNTRPRGGLFYQETFYFPCNPRILNALAAKKFVRIFPCRRAYSGDSSRSGFSISFNPANGRYPSDGSSSLYAVEVALEPVAS